MSCRLDFEAGIQEAGSMKATVQIPDELYRAVEAEAARDGVAVREVAISLFARWLREKKQTVPHATGIDWESFRPPLAQWMPGEVTEHGTEAMRRSVISQWDEPS